MGVREPVGAGCGRRRSRRRRRAGRLPRRPTLARRRDAAAVTGGGRRAGCFTTATSAPGASPSPTTSSAVSAPSPGASAWMTIGRPLNGQPRLQPHSAPCEARCPSPAGTRLCPRPSRRVASRSRRSWSSICSWTICVAMAIDEEGACERGGPSSHVRCCFAGRAGSRRPHGMTRHCSGHRPPYAAFSALDGFDVGLPPGWGQLEVLGFDPAIGSVEVAQVSLHPGPFTARQQLVGHFQAHLSPQCPASFVL